MKHVFSVAPLVVLGCGVIALAVAALIARTRPRAFAASAGGLRARLGALRRDVLHTYRDWQRFRAFNRALAEFRRNAPVLRTKPSDSEVGAPRD